MTRVVSYLEYETDDATGCLVLGPEGGTSTLTRRVGLLFGKEPGNYMI